MRFTARAFGLVFAVGAAACLPGCATSHRAPVADDPYVKAAANLDYVARSVEKYGAISVSAPFILNPSKDFEFGLHRTGEDYFNDGRVEGFVRNAEFQVFDAQVAVSANLEEVVKAIKAFQGGSSLSKVDVLRKALTDFQTAQGGIDAAVNASGGLDALTPQQKEAVSLAKTILTRAEEIEQEQAEAQPPTFENPEMPDLLKPEDRVALSALPDDFTPILPNFTGDVDISPRQKVNLAASDKMQQEILNWFGYPKAADLGPNKVVYLCLLTVTCTPGALTRKGFAGEVSVNVEYGRKEEKVVEGKKVNVVVALEDRTHGTPLVVAAYPMIDSQVLDLSSSIRKQLSFAAALRAVGFGIAGQAVADYAQRLEQDAKTRSAITVGGATSYGGQNFGYRVEPRLAAIGNVNSIKGKAEQKLETQSFPAVVLLVLDKADLAPKFGGTGSGTATSIRFSPSGRWMPLEGGFKSNAVALREAEILTRAANLDEATDFIQARAGESELWKYQELRRRIYGLAAVGLGAKNWQELPERAPESREYSVSPSIAWQNSAAIFHVCGPDLDLVTTATVGGVACEILDQRPASIVVKFPGLPGGSADTGDTVLNLILTTPTKTIDAGLISFSKSAKKPCPSCDESPSLTINRDAAGNITLLEIKGEVDDVTKLDALTELLKSGQSGSFEIEIDGSASAKASASAKS